MSDWSDGYVTEVDYTYGFYREMSPAMMRFATLAAGYEAPPIDKFNYCELGFGQGAGLNLLAASNAQGEFFGTDFNPAHAAGAQRLAQASGLKNLQVFDDSFEQFAGRDLPQFDYIALHGVYSWVGAENRKHIVEFLRRHLRVGGALYISYNTQPGWAGFMPTRELLHRHVYSQAAEGVPLKQRTAQALEFIKQLAALPTGYFSQNPGAKEQLNRIAQQDPSYLAHEYLNRHWDPLYFEDVAAELEGAKLSFVGPADIGSRVDMMQLSAEVQKLYASVSDPLYRETVRDFLVGQRFRRDIFIRGARKMPASAQTNQLMEIPVALVRPRAECKYQIQIGSVNVTLKPEAYDPVLDALEKGPHSCSQLLQIPALREQGPQRTFQALLVLIGANYAQPCSTPAAAKASVASCAQFNRVSCAETAAMYPTLSNLASPVLGSGIGTSRVAKIFFDGYFQRQLKSSKDLSEHAWNVFKGVGQQLIKDGKPLQGDEANLAELAQQADQIRVSAGLFRSLGVADL